METTIQDLLNCLDEIAPFAIAESWDNVGLLIGDRTRSVDSLLIGLDPTNRLLQEALEIGADTIITHHPAIFKPIPFIDTAGPEGRFLETALSHRLNVLACHTNLDSTSLGVNDALAELLGLRELRPLIPAADHPMQGAGLGRIGLYPEKVDRDAFVRRVLEALQLPSLQIAGELPATISCVAVCGGSGSDLAELARNCGAEVYLSAEIKHHAARWAEEAGFCIVDGSHYATEKPAVALLAERLRQYAYHQGWELQIAETRSERHPFTTVTADSYTTE